MDKKKLHLVLADDDIDDCDFFKEAIDELSYPIILTVLNDGVQLMDFLTTNSNVNPNLIFLDLNMPLKSGMECLNEIKSKETLKHLPIIIYSTSRDRTVVNELYELGAFHYIQKPSEFSNIKMVVEKVIASYINNNSLKRSIDQFIIEP